MAKGKHALVQTIKKIPIFAGLSPSHIQSILDICTSVKCDPNQTIYAANAASDQMHILLSGELSVVNDEGIRLARLYPITTVGEMGLVTRHTRSASVETGKPSNMLVLQRRAFDALLRREPELQTKFYQNVIGILAGKIVGDNVRVRDHLLEKVEHQRDLRFERRRADSIMQLLLENSDLSEEEESISNKAMAVLKRTEGTDEKYIFPGKEVGLSNMAMLALLKRMGRKDITVHGFRSTFRDWAAEQTAYANHVVEMALAHTISDQVEKAYRRGELLEKRTNLMEDWARYMALSPATGNVSSLRGSQHG